MTRTHGQQVPSARLETELATTTARVEKVADATANMGHSDTLARRLK